ncbi:IclR family transcriptional regulator [Catenuloplanes indicus]|uniref:Glycerol operon regulatory protein n=1 Tax=Catenuloplanes indicus TaxID=137267 RepID=A0AAE3W6J6_9ACTN|nr:IclR family transcriptional regulator [Catenuloplanes indicus]MDQ0370858.1 DNA-binding IclR family transcriptional regulator [Catenuloplanes indicus]
MPGLIQSIERSSAMLRLIGAAPAGLRVKEIADALGLAKSTAHSILRTLAHVGFVAQDPRDDRYRLGDALRTLGTGVDPNELRARALDWADTLAVRSRETVRVAALRDGAAVVAHHVFRPDDSAQRLEIGRRLPLHATALGKVLLAYAAGGTDVVLEPFTRSTITSDARLRAALAETRARGWAAAVGEHDAGTAGIAAPLRTTGGLVVGAIGVSGPVDRVCDTTGRPRARLVTHVADAARATSRALAR